LGVSHDLEWPAPPSAPARGTATGAYRFGGIVAVPCFSAVSTVNPVDVVRGSDLVDDGLEMIAESVRACLTALFWTSPELLRDITQPRNGTQPGDVYSVGILFFNILYRLPPYQTDDYTALVPRGQSRVPRCSSTPSSSM